MKDIVAQNPSFEIETDFLFSGKKIIAGVDEAGRGALAGPLSVAMVIFPSHFFQSPDNLPDLFSQINDSKKMRREKRESVLDFIYDNALFASHIFISSEMIDSSNINKATEFAVIELFKKADPCPDFLLLDGNFRFNLPVEYLSVKKGDAKSLSIAAASIIAKVKRDQFMANISGEYPSYGFDKHAGYGTKKHIEAIRQFGVSEIHRKTYEPCKSILEKGLFDN